MEKSSDRSTSDMQSTSSWQRCQCTAVGGRITNWVNRKGPIEYPFLKKNYYLMQYITEILDRSWT